MGKKRVWYPSAASGEGGGVVIKYFYPMVGERGAFKLGGGGRSLLLGAGIGGELFLAAEVLKRGARGGEEDEGLNCRFDVGDGGSKEGHVAGRLGSGCEGWGR